MLESVALAFAALRETMLLAAFGMALSGVDDLFVDLIFLVRRAFRMIAVRPRNRRVTVEELGSDDPGWFAVLVPAWDEAAVIGTMLRGLVNTYDYPRYRVFVGSYPNDPATQAEIASVGDPRIEHVMTARRGPTTNADCLNHLWRAALAHEARGIR